MNLNIVADMMGKVREGIEIGKTVEHINRFCSAHFGFFRWLNDVEGCFCFASEEGQ